MPNEHPAVSSCRYLGTARAGEVVIDRCVGKWSNDSNEYYVDKTWV